METKHPSSGINRNCFQLRRIIRDLDGILRIQIMTFTNRKSRNPRILFTSWWIEISSAKLNYGRWFCNLLCVTNIESTGSLTGKNIVNRDLSKSLQWFSVIVDSKYEGIIYVYLCRNSSCRVDSIELFEGLVGAYLMISIVQLTKLTIAWISQNKCWILNHISKVLKDPDPRAPKFLNSEHSHKNLDCTCTQVWDTFDYLFTICRAKRSPHNPREMQSNKVLS